jgi:hypothetical protein
MKESWRIVVDVIRIFRSVETVELFGLVDLTTAKRVPR